MAALRAGQWAATVGGPKAVIAVAHKVGATMKRMSLRGAVRKVGERQKASVWRL